MRGRKFSLSLALLCAHVCACKGKRIGGISSVLLSPPTPSLSCAWARAHVRGRRRRWRVFTSYPISHFFLLVPPSLPPHLLLSVSLFRCTSAPYCLLCVILFFILHSPFPPCSLMHVCVHTQVRGRGRKKILPSTFFTSSSHALVQQKIFVVHKLLPWKPHSFSLLLFLLSFYGHDCLFKLYKSNRTDLNSMKKKLGFLMLHSIC